MSRTGVYVCHCGENIAGSVDVAAVRAAAEKLPGVAVAREYLFMCSDPGQELIRKDIEDGLVDRVVVAACTPRTHEPIFRRALAGAGLNRYLFEMANIRDQDSWAHWAQKDAATEKAARLVAGAVAKVNLLAPVEDRFVDVLPAAMVVGGGVAGMFAALDLAGMGFSVYLVEREASLGGNMAKLDKTFPTNDCSACVLTPVMVQAGTHPKIKVMANCEIESVQGSIGNFRVTVARKSTHVDWQLCNGCGDCTKACPVAVPDPFNEGMSERRAAAIAFPQAVPKKAVIERRGTSPCSFFCPAGVKAHGYVALTRAGRYGEAFESVLGDTPLVGTLGQACYAPCETQCTRGGLDGALPIRSLKQFLATEYYREHPEAAAREKPPGTGQRVAVVGSGPAGLTCAYHLALKGHRVKIFEASATPGGLLALAIPSYRLPPEVVARDIQNVTALGVEIETGVRVEDAAALAERGFDAVFLAIGASVTQPLQVEGEYLAGVEKALDFLREVKAGRVPSLAGRTVAVIGGGNVAMDCARSALRLGAAKVTVFYRRTRAEMAAHEWEVKAAEKDGVEFRFLVTPQRLVGSDGRLTAMETIEVKPGAYGPSGKTRPVPVPGTERLMDVDMVIGAVGLAPAPGKLAAQMEFYGNGMIKVDGRTFQTSLPYVFAGGDVVSGPSTIVEAAGQGRRAAFVIDRYLRGEDLTLAAGEERLPLADRDEVLQSARGRIAAVGLERDSGCAAAEEILTPGQARAQAGRCLDCGVCSECGQCVAACRLHAVDLAALDTREDVEVGVIILATGYRAMDKTPFREYSPQSPNVVTSVQMERLLSATGPTEGDLLRPSDGRRPQGVAFVSCVGSRDKNHHGYCSKVCCMYMLKEARLVKEKYPDTDVAVFFVDVRTPGKDFEEYYDYCREIGVRVIRGRVGAVDELAEGRLRVRAFDVDLGCPVSLETDMVVLATAIEPASGSEELARKMGVACGAEGFLREVHTKLYPVETAAKGIYIAGCAQGPKDIPESVSQGRAAAAAAAVPLASGRVEVEPFRSSVDQDRCSGCGICIPLCPYGAIGRDSLGEKFRARIDEALCAGCGVCAAACPSAAITLTGFTAEQVTAQIEALAG